MATSTKPPAVQQKPSLSSLNFQIALHYNALFSALFAIVIGACSIEKVRPRCRKIYDRVWTCWFYNDAYMVSISTWQQSIRDLNQLSWPQRSKWFRTYIKILILSFFIAVILLQQKGQHLGDLYLGWNRACAVILWVFRELKREGKKRANAVFLLNDY